jgi:hypothetical protein
MMKLFRPGMSRQRLHHGKTSALFDLAITTVLVIKRVFRLTLRAAQGFIDSIFTDEWVMPLIS